MACANVCELLACAKATCMLLSMSFSHLPGTNLVPARSFSSEKNGIGGDLHELITTPGPFDKKSLDFGELVRFPIKIRNCLGAEVPWTLNTWSDKETW